MNSDMLWDPCWGSRQKDPREDDHDYYRWGHEWVKRTVWTADNVPSCSDHEAHLRFIMETSEGQRRAILEERMRRKGLVHWHHSWVTPERAKELERNWQEGVERARRIEKERLYDRPRYPVLWC